MNLNKIIATIMAIGLMAAPMQAFAATGATSTTGDSVISVSGQGRVNEKPDKATLSITFDTKSKTLRDTNVKSRAHQDALLKAFAKFGVTAADISTSYWNWYPELSYDEAGKSAIASYNASRSVNVNFISNIDRVEDAIDSIPSVYGVNVTSSSVSYMLTNSSKAFEKGRALAIADAKTKATSLAKELGVTLGGITRVDDTNSYYEVYASNPSEAIVDYYITVTYKFN